MPAAAPTTTATKSSADAAASSDRHRIVSSESDALILVDANDQEVGSLSKAECHDGAGQRHRAFSLFVFNDDGELLLQQRAANKRLWPLFWSNSCCSHPRVGETQEHAASRRLQEELGMAAELQYLYRFEYVAHYQNQGTEHELCSVYAGTARSKPSVNRSEIADWRWVAPETLSTELAQDRDRFTPWFQLEWQRICRDFSHLLRAPS